MARNSHWTRTEGLRRVAGVASFLIMAACGALVSGQFRDQYIHATPPAIFVACACSSLISGGLGWWFAGIYVRSPNVAVVAFPVAVPILTTATAAILYIAVQPVFRGGEYWTGVSSHVGNLLVYMTGYLTSSAIIWLPAFLATAVLLRRAIARRGR